MLKFISVTGHLSANWRRDGREGACRYRGSLRGALPRATAGLMLPLLLLLETMARVHGVAAEGTADGAAIHENSFSNLPLPVSIAILIVSLLFAAICCGLSVGLMGMDTVMLEIVASAGSEPDRSYAQSILPLRQLGHQMLTTLIIGNMLATVLASQMVAAIVPAGNGSELKSFIIATLLLFILAEVLPMSVCKSERSLMIASKSVPVLMLLCIIMYPVAMPLGWLLDHIVHTEGGQLYDRNEFKRLMHMHCERHPDRSGMGMDEMRMVIGVLELQERTAGSITTPMDEVFMLEGSHPIDRKLIDRLWVTGRSRVPVYLGQRENVVGVLYVKDLITNSALAMSGTLTVLDILRENPREYYIVKETLSLQELLFVFQSRASHLLFVEGAGGADNDDEKKVRVAPPCPVADEVEGDDKATLLRHAVRVLPPHPELEYTVDVEAAPAAGMERVEGAVVQVSPDGHGRRVPQPLPFLGIISLEDLIEKLIRSEIYDEYDVEVSSSDEGTETDGEELRVLSEAEQPLLVGDGRRPVAAPRLTTRRPHHMPRVNFYSYYVDGEVDTPLDDNQRWVLAQYMIRTFVYFASWKLRSVKMLIDRVGDTILRVSPDQQRASEMFDEMGGVIPESGSSAIPASKDHILYLIHRESDVFTLLLSGGVRMVVGKEGFTTEARSFASFGEAVLLEKSFTPLYTAVVVRTSRLMQIRYSDIADIEQRIHTRKLIKGQQRAGPNVPFLAGS